MSRVLIVEDEVSLRELYADFLRDSGYVVDVASDGESALDKINRGEWDVLLLDIMLPKLDGMEVLKSITTDSLLNSKPILIMSNLEDPAIIRRCLEAGAKEFLAKAELTPPDIIAAIERTLGNDQNKAPDNF